MRGQPSSHRLALGQAVLVTLLWSTSWILIKVGLNDLDLAPLSFAGARYFLAALILLPFAWPAVRHVPTSVTRAERRRVLAWAAVLGVILYAVTQGAQFAALAHLPAVAVALALTVTPVVVAALTLRASERPTALQVTGAVALIAGAALYYGPLDLGDGGALGLLIIAVGVLANALSAMLGRVLARDSLPAIGGVVGLTAVSMLVGSSVLLIGGIIVEGAPRLNLQAWLIVGWLAIVNTAFAFTLWNQTMRTLTAVESSVINNLLLVEVALLAWLVLGEELDPRQLLGLAIAAVGILAVQIRRAAPLQPVADEVLHD
jgi:drug/metabolite transporter (DMT)-like permease